MFIKIYEKIKTFIKENYKGLIILIAIFLLFTIELPYSIYTPGGSVNLNERIEVDTEFEINGSFNMAYVSMVKGSIPFLLVSKIIPDWDIIKKEDITIKGEDMDSMINRERLYLKESRDAATINAYKKAQKDLKITSVINNVSYIASEANTDLKIGDIILSVNDKKIETLNDLKSIIGSLAKDTKVSLKIKRNDKEEMAYAYTYETDDGIKIGVSLITTYLYDANPNIDIKSKSSEMGSSGGLMMSLTIYNKLVEKDITKGRKIVGTGTIDIDGNVGEIGGIKYKLKGAVAEDADIFLVPSENYKEAMNEKIKNDYEIDIISVSSFDEAIDALECYLME